MSSPINLQPTQPGNRNTTLVQADNAAPAGVNSPNPAQSHSKEIMGAWNGWKKTFIRDLPKGSIVYDDANKKGPSEGMGYGMYLGMELAVEVEDQKTFDRLIAGLDSYFAKSNGLFYWYITATGTLHPKTREVQNPDGSAADADVYIAASLIQAHSLVLAGKWKAPKGASYLDRAQKIINAIWKNEVIKRGNRLILKPSDLGWPEWGDGKVAYNPSYFIPTWFKLFAKVDKDPSHDWNKLVSDGYDLMNVVLSNTSTLKPKGQNPVPDWVLLSVSGNNFRLEGYNSITPDNEYDAIRVPVEIGRDAILNNDARAVSFLKKFIAQANVTNEGSVKIDGWANELTWACYGVALKAIGDPGNYLPGYLGALKASFKGDYFGFTPSDKTNYYKQTVVLIAATMLL